MAPAKASAPPAIQVARNSHGFGTFAAMPGEKNRMPPPMTLEMMMAAASKGPSRRASVVGAARVTRADYKSLRARVLEAANEKIGEEIGDLLRGGGAVGIEPARNPVHRAENREREQLGIASTELPFRDSVLEHLAHAALEAIAPCDDRLQVRRRQRLQIEQQRRPVQLVENRVDERDDEPPQLLVRIHAALLDIVEQLHEEVERVLVAGGEDLFLVAEVVIEVALLHVQRRRDLLDGRPLIAELAKGLGRRLEDVDARRHGRAGVARAAAAAAAQRRGARDRG